MTLQASSFPKRIEIELASSCNLKCSYCPRQYLGTLKGFIDFGLFKKIVDEASQYPGTVIVLHRRGESMLHPAFNDILDYVAGKFKEVQMATNATLLDDNKFEPIIKAVNFLSFSLDTPETYNRTRSPACYEVVEEKILKFLKFNKGRITTQASMVRIETTIDEEMELFKTIWKDRVDRVRIYEEHSVNGVFGAIRNPRKERKPCVMPFYELLIYDDGKVGRCNHDWNGDPMADANTSSIKKIWNNPKYQRLRNEHLNLQLTDPVCKGCDSWYPEIGVQGTGDVIERH